MPLGSFLPDDLVTALTSAGANNPDPRAQGSRGLMLALLAPRLAEIREKQSGIESEARQTRDLGRLESVLGMNRAVRDRAAAGPVVQDLFKRALGIEAPDDLGPTAFEKQATLERFRRQKGSVPPELLQKAVGLDTSLFGDPQFAQLNDDQQLGIARIFTSMEGAKARQDQSSTNAENLAINRMMQSRMNIMAKALAVNKIADEDMDAAQGPMEALNAEIEAHNNTYGDVPSFRGIAPYEPAETEGWYQWALGWMSGKQRGSIKPGERAATPTSSSVEAPSKVPVKGGLNPTTTEALTPMPGDSDEVLLDKAMRQAREQFPNFSDQLIEREVIRKLRVWELEFGRKIIAD